MEIIKAYLGIASLALARFLSGVDAQLLGLRAFSWCQAEQVKHVAIYRVGNIGDIVVALPALLFLRQQLPQATLTLITSAGNGSLPGAGDVLSPFKGLVDHIVTYQPAELKSHRGLHAMKARVIELAGPVDVFVDLPVTMQTLRRTLQEQLLAFTLRARWCLGFDILLPPLFKRDYARRFPKRIPRTSDWLLSLLNPAGRKVQARPAHLSAIPWEAWRLNPGEPILVVNAGAKLAIKRWSPEAYADLIAEVMRGNPMLQVAFIGTEEEDPLNQRIIETIISKYPIMTVGITNLSGKLTLLDTWSLVNQARAVLSNDTGTMHIAGVLNKPVVTPMSGQYPAPLWHPPGHSLIAFRKEVSCAPCFLDRCPLEEQVCMTRIAPYELRLALEEALNPPEAKPEEGAS